MKMYAMRLLCMMMQQAFFESPGENKRKIFAQISVLVLKENFNVIWLRHALKYSTSKLNQIVGWSFC